MALPKFLRRDPVAAFWRWFGKNAQQIAQDIKAYEGEGEPSPLVTIELVRRLRRIHPSLVHEIGESEEVIELIVSADGDLDAFGAVAETVSCAPTTPGYAFTAFRKRSGPDFALGMFGHEVSFRQVRYESWPEDEKLGVRVHIAIEGLDEEDLDAMAFVLLDMALGEYDVATGLGSIEAATGRPSNAKPFAGLAAEFDAFRQPTVH
jgi:hypothetical protein